MHPRTAEHRFSPAHSNQERRAEHRDQIIGNLWMIDSTTSTVLRCQCVDASKRGMRLRVPAGYGVSEGQQYELSSHLPGQSSPPGLGLMVSRHAVVVRTEITPSDDEYDVDVGVVLAPSRTAVLTPDKDLLTAVS